jgi:SagB-type dehydrogenase family enzyme
MKKRIYETTKYEPISEEEHLWELFHDNSKIELHAPITPTNEVLSRMEGTFDSILYSSRDVLPIPTLNEPMEDNGLDHCIATRQSEREWSPSEITFEEIGRLLRAYAINRTNEDTEFVLPFRSTPSGGGLFPLEIYLSVRNCVDLDPGLYHFSPKDWALTSLRQGDLTSALAECFVQQDVVYNAAVTILITGVFSRSTFKYGDRGYRFTLLEAGHLAQNFCLYATEMGMSNLCMGGYFDRKVDDFLAIDGVTHSTVYAFSVGRKTHAKLESE